MKKPNIVFTKIRTNVLLICLLLLCLGIGAMIANMENVLLAIVVALASAVKELTSD